MRPSALEQYIATLPEDLQRVALQAVKEEVERLQQGDYTPEEVEAQKISAALGAAFRRTMDMVILDLLKK